MVKLKSKFMIDLNFFIYFVSIFWMITLIETELV